MTHTNLSDSKINHLQLFSEGSANASATGLEAKSLALELFQEGEVKKEEVIKPPKITKRGGHYCCVMGCNKNTKTDKPETQFFSIPAQSKATQRALWLKAINRVNADGTPWAPKTSTNGLVWSRLFVSGKPSSMTNDPDNYPSLELGYSHQQRPKTIKDKARFERYLKRRFADSAVGPSTKYDSLQ